jgi:hypothetical protein
MDNLFVRDGIFSRPVFQQGVADVNGTKVATMLRPAAESLARQINAHNSHVRAWIEPANNATGNLLRYKVQVERRR